MKRQKTQNRQHNTEKEEKSWRTDTTYPTPRLTVKLQ